MSGTDQSADELPTATYRGKCPETGGQIETEVLCPDGWTVTQLSVYGIRYERDADGLVAHHGLDDRRAGRDPHDTLVIDGETVLDGRVTKRDAVEHLSQLSDNLDTGGSRNARSADADTEDSSQ